MAPGLRAAAGLWCTAVVCLGAVIGWRVDVIGGAMLVLMGALGWRGFKRGGVRSLLALVAMLAAYAWAMPLGRLWAPGMQILFGVPLAPARYATATLVAVVMILCGEVAGVWLARRYDLAARPATRNARGLGLLFGMAEGGVLALTLALILVAVQPPARMALSLNLELPRHRWAYDQLGRLQAHVETAPVAGRLAELYADNHEVLHMGGGLALLTRYPNALRELKGLPEIQELLAAEPDLARAVREIKLDRDLKRAVLRGDLRGILNSPTVPRLLEDQPLAGAIARHRATLLAALVRAVSEGQREKFAGELARLHGVTPVQLLSFAGRDATPGGAVY